MRDFDFCARAGYTKWAKKLWRRSMETRKERLRNLEKGQAGGLFRPTNKRVGLLHPARRVVPDEEPEADAAEKPAPDDPAAHSQADDEAT